MTKKSGSGSSRAQRKRTRLRQRRAQLHGLPSPELATTPKRRLGAGKAGDTVGARATAAAERKRPSSVKIALFLLGLIALIWLLSRLRQM